MLKRTFAALISVVLSLIPLSATAGSQTKSKAWDPSERSGKVKAQKYVTPDGKRILIAPDGKRYLLDSTGKRYMGDQNGNQLQGDRAGRILEMNQQKKVKLRIGPGPLA